MESLYSQLREAIKYSGYSQAELARRTGVQQASISRFIKETQGLSAENAISLANFLGGRFSFPAKDGTTATLRRTGANSPAEIVEGDGLCSVPVLGAAGAGGAVEFFATEPETVIQVMAQYAVAGVVALHIEGDSMEPTIRKGSYVGVVPMEGKIIEGNIYLVDLPHLGRVVKRIRMRSDGRLELYSDNPKFEPRPLPDEGYEHIIVGRVVWIWQLC